MTWTYRLISTADKLGLDAKQKLYGEPKNVMFAVAKVYYTKEYQITSSLKVQK
jgi:hypothetical protein